MRVTRAYTGVRMRTKSKYKSFAVFTAIAAAFCVLLVLLSACSSPEVVISFNSMGGSPVEPIKPSELEADEEGNVSVVLPSTTRSGYVFTGWYRDRACTEAVSNVLSGEDVPVRSCTFYAGWKEEVYTVTFTVEGQVVATYKKTHGSYFYEKDFPSLSEYPSYEWAVSSFKVTYNRVIEATLRRDLPEPEYTVTYFAPDENKEYNVYKSYKGVVGAAIEQPDEPPQPADGKDHYFTGWFEDASLKNEVATLPSEITAVNLELYAGFEEITDDSAYLYYSEVEGGVVITGLNSVGRYQTTIGIPSAIGGKEVIGIGYKNVNPTDAKQSATFTSTYLRTVILPSTLTYVGDWAFFDCPELRQVVFAGDKVSSIGAGAFAGCSSLETLDLPDNVTAIGKFAFAGISANGEKKCEIEALKPYGEFFAAQSAMFELKLSETSKLSLLGDYAFYNCGLFENVKLSKVMRDFNYLAFSGSGVKNIEFYEGGILAGYNGAVYSFGGRTLYYYPACGEEEFVLSDATVNIADNAFRGNDKIKTIVFDSALVAAGDSAFEECDNLSTLDFGETKIKNVGNNAFKNCAKLTSVTFGAELTELGSGAFSGCGALTAVTFNGGKLAEIKDYAFYDCKSLTSFLTPAAVFDIGNYAFNGCERLASLRFEAFDALKTIGDYAFSDCLLLSEVTFPSSITEFGNYAFAGLKGAMGLQISEDTSLNEVTRYGEYSFYNTSIKKITVSSKIASDDSLGKYAFAECRMLSKIIFDESERGEGGVYKYGRIAEGLLYGCIKLEEVSFRNNITAVGTKAFFGCSALTKADFNSVKIIESSAFENCVALLNNGGSSRVMPLKLVSLGERAFANCRSLAYVNVPKGLSYISEEAFINCSALEEILYDEGGVLTTIKENAFANCTSLRTAKLPETLALKDKDGVYGLVKNPFIGCTRLTAFEFDKENVNKLYVVGGVVYRALTALDGTVYEYNGASMPKETAIYAFPTAKATTNVVIGSEVSEIDDYAFYGATITGVEFAKNASEGAVEQTLLIKIGDYAFASSKATVAKISYRVYEVGAHAFENCAVETLETSDVYIDKTDATHKIVNSCVKIDNNLLTIKGYAFRNTSVETLTLPERTASIEEYAFADNYRLKELNFAGGALTSLVIGDYAFFASSGLQKLLLTSNLTRIGDGAFSECRNVNSITFAESTEKLVIGEEAFSEIHYLYEAEIPANVTSLGRGVFKGDTRLKYIYFALTNDNGLVIPEEAFAGADSIESFTVPAYVTEIGIRAFYKTHLTSLTILSDANSSLEINDEAFAYASLLQEASLPSSVTRIGDSAFAFSALSDFVAADGEKPLSIGRYAFAGTQLSEVELPARTTALEEGAFANNALLTKIDLGSGVEEIGDGAFQGSNLLTYVTCGNVGKVGAYAFYGTNVTTIDCTTVYEVGEYAFAESALIRFVSDTTEAVKISDNAFLDCKELSEVSIKTSSTLSVGEKAFFDCAKLSVLNAECATASLGGGFAGNATSLSDGFVLTETSIDANYAFDKTEHVAYKSDYTEFVFYPAGKKGSTFVLRNETTSFAPYAFYGNDKLTGVVIPGDGVASKQATSFEGMGELVFYVGAEYVSAYRNDWGIDNVQAYTLKGGFFILTMQNSGEYHISGYLGTETDVNITGEIKETVDVKKTVIGDDGNEKEIIEKQERTYTVTGIDDGAFRNNRYLRNAVVSGGVKTIGASAFYNCENLVSVVLGDNVTSIKNYAFYNCGSLSLVTFAEDGSLTSIGNYAFYGNASLTEVTIPSSVESVGIFAFAKCDNLSKVVIENGTEEIGNNAFAECISLTDLTLPESLIKLGGYVFDGCERLVYIVFKGESVPTIESDTFNGLNEGVYYFVPERSAKAYKSDSVWRPVITKIIPVENVCTIEGYENYVYERMDADSYKLVAYIGDETITDVTIESQIADGVSIVSVGSYAFGQFVKKVTLSEGILSVEEKAFSHAVNLEKIVFPASLKTIGAYSFAGLKKLSDIVFAPSSCLTTINAHAFGDCPSIKKISLPASLKTIGDYAFSSEIGEEMNLSEVIFEHDAISSFEEIYIAEIGEYAFAGNPKIETLTFNCVVKRIREGAFSGCERLESIYLNYVGASASRVENGSVTVIPENATKVFDGCDKLSVIVTPIAINDYKANFNYIYDRYKLVENKYVVKDGKLGTFVCDVISSNNLTVTITNYLGGSESGDDEVVEFPSAVYIQGNRYSVVKIGRVNNNNENVLNGYVIGSDVREVIIPTSVTTIGADAFRNSKNLVTVNIIDKAGQLSRLTTIEAHAFENSVNLRNIKIPKTVERIEDYAFAYCSSLNDGLEFAKYNDFLSGKGTLAIGKYAFAGCDGLEKINLPMHLATVGEYAFKDCVALKTVEFPLDSKTETLGRYVFSGAAIEEITIPASMVEVGNYAFDRCTSLKGVYLTRETSDSVSSGTRTAKNVFNEVGNAHLKVYSPVSMTSSYASYIGWNEATVIDNLITGDGLYAYRPDENGTSATLTAYRGNDKILTLPRRITVGANFYTVTTIGKHFANATVEKVVFPTNSQITRLESYAFSNCVSLKEISIPDSVNSVGAQAFNGCVSLVDVTLSKSITVIEANMFSNCTSLKEITIPESVETIGVAAFYNCYNLTRIIINFTKVGELGNMAFEDTGKESSARLCIIVPEKSKSDFLSQWGLGNEYIYSFDYLIGDFVVNPSADGKSWTLVQYAGKEDTLDLTKITLNGKKITAVSARSLDRKIELITDETIEVDESYSDYIKTNE